MGRAFALIGPLNDLSALQSVFVQSTGFILLNPDADQLAREIMPLGEPVKGLSGNELLRDLALERNAVRTLSGHGFHSSKAQHSLSNH